MISRRKAITWLAILLVITNLFTFLLVMGKVPVLSGLLSEVAPGWVVPPGISVLSPHYRQFWEAMQLVQQNYVEPVGPKEIDQMLDGATSGLVASVNDPYTVYFSPEEYKSWMEETSGQYSGVGMVVEYVKPYVTVVAPFPDTPAARAGIRSGDKIIKVDGKDVVGVDVDVVANMIKGPEGTPVTLTILRDDEQPFDVTLVRAVIHIPTVDHAMLTPTIGYVRLYQFSEGAAALMSQAIADLKAKGAKGIIFDLRQDPGGLLSEAIPIASLFIPDGPVMRRISRGGAEVTYYTCGGQISENPCSGTSSQGLGMPYVVLVDGGSASASEIVSGAIHDRGSGVLVGTKTFGKGSVQNLWPLPGGGGVKITTSRYLTPNGNAVDKVGITPDVVVEQGEVKPGQPSINLEDPKDPRNVQLIKAIQILQQKLGGTP